MWIVFEVAEERFETGFAAPNLAKKVRGIPDRLVRSDLSRCRRAVFQGRACLGDHECRFYPLVIDRSQSRQSLLCVGSLSRFVLRVGKQLKRQWVLRVFH